MSFDWTRFFEQRGIEFATTGKNVNKGNVVIHCPFCGSEDASQHLSVSLTGKGWRCWRRPGDHYGRSPTRLVQALLGCSFEQAAAITGSSVHIPEDFMSRVTSALRPAPLPITEPPLRMPKQFKSIDTRLYSCRPYAAYLERRGFERRTIDSLSRRYGMRYATSGPFAGRIIFPITYEEQLVTWTGRAIGNSDLRYKTLSDNADRAKDEGLPRARGTITDYLLFFDELIHQHTADTICLVEGPFDALKVSVLGSDEGVCATCFSTATPSPQQVNLLHELLPRFKRRILLLDQDTLPNALKTANTLSNLNVTVRTLPEKIKDPGDLKNFYELRDIVLAHHTERPYV